MTLRERLQWVDRLQKSRPFKIVGSIVVLVAAIVALSVYIVSVTAPGNRVRLMPVESAPATQPEEAGATAAQPGAPASAPGESALDTGAKVLQDILDRRQDVGSVAVGIVLLTAVALVIVWLGLGLTYLVLLAVAWGIGLPLAQTTGAAGLGRLLLGVVTLTAAFTALMQGLRSVLSLPGPVFAIARNVLAEAVRMKISLVFIVILIFGLAALPGLLDQDQPLRYRVQAFLQYGTGGAFWIIALLIVFFSTATVAFEQRDRVIWQTMTKPVAPWQYVLGKWLGVASLGAVLLAVSTSGVFLFVEHLRSQPAIGEIEPYVAAGGQPITEDRLILETQVLAARVSVEPPEPISRDSEEFLKSANDYIKEQQQRDPNFNPTRDHAALEKVLDELYKSVVLSYRSIAPGDGRFFPFPGLASAKSENRPVILKYRIDAGDNRPDQLYKLTFLFDTPRGQVTTIRDVVPGISQTLPLSPAMIANDGSVKVAIYNGDITTGQSNPRTVSFPPGGLEVSWSESSYQANFLRVVVILWIKLAFIAMIGIWAATFLSFSVATLIACAAFIAAESTGFIFTSLEAYPTTDDQGNVVIYKAIVYYISTGVAWMFKLYSNLKPTTRLVDGRLLSWSSVALGATVLGAWTLLLYGMATYCFRRRELAIYSGH